MMSLFGSEECFSFSNSDSEVSLIDYNFHFFLVSKNSFIQGEKNISEFCLQFLNEILGSSRSAFIQEINTSKIVTFNEQS